ncbi:putative COP9 signalosome complex subunit 4 [Dioszegia hungarica]|uniref:COP9 signalosome complex subunit 4 n=1 Tax=Dioszegia hungarica TaxID=4972 RepID=A0AA38LRA4_9TREE|nr:putative COP9 signalosome complex subunit 4 [Dioszegia hungarica]KAI9634212.1 putative COP9 signalosome complex subunit 4 [Dioszegia hungarica]
MDVEGDITSQLEGIASASNQRDRGTAYLSLLSSLLNPPPQHASQLITFGTHFTTSTTMTMVVGRRVLGAYVMALCGGSTISEKDKKISGGDEGGDESKWEEAGKAAFQGEKGEDVRREVVEGVLDAPGMAGWCDEQTTVLRKLYSEILQSDEDWIGAARALIKIPLEGGSRLVPDEDKLAVYMKIVRLLLESGESGQAQTYFSRASLLIRPESDKITQLQYRLSQARLADYSAKFNEAAQKYHELSFDVSIDEEERTQMLKSAVTTSILAPAGPQRSRILAALNRDERVQSNLAAHLSGMLRKMLLEYIVRNEEVKEFEAGLEDHQRAKVEGGGTVLERAVREHNVGACGKVYDNVSFEALGSILNLDADGAEATARRMIEQGRLRAWIDQPLSLLYFESRSEHDTDANAQGTAGGLGVERVEKLIEPVSWVERWDDRIRDTSNKVESIATAIQAQGLLANGVKA